MNAGGDLELGRLQPQPAPSTLHTSPRRFATTTQRGFQENHCLLSNAGSWIKEVLPWPATGPDLWPINVVSRKITACSRTPDAGLKRSSHHPQLGQTYDRSICPNGWQFIWQLQTGTGHARVRVTVLPIDLLLAAFKWATPTPPEVGISHPSWESFGYRILYP